MHLNQSRLSSVSYPDSIQKRNADKEECAMAGVAMSVSDPASLMRYLGLEDMARIASVLDDIGPGRGNGVRVSQAVWTETFAYDRNGNRASKTTPWGTIVFRYDAENRLVSKGSIEYRYDAPGNLLSETGLRKKALYDYTANGRMKTSIVVDEVKKTRAVTNYRYDAFGRRTLAQDEGGKLMRTLYDGMSFEPIREAVSYADGTLTTTLATRSTRQSGESEGRYAWIDGSGTDRSAFLDGDGYSLISGRFVGTRVNLYANGTGVASSRSPDASAGESSAGTAGVSYLGHDGLGSVSSASDEYGSLEDVFLYDAFGKPYEGDFTAGISLGYTGKPYDPITGLYDYGYRDYSPDTARFTTVDPIRDGTNWFAYVNNDPVNFTDPTGLVGTVVAGAVAGGTIGFIAGAASSIIVGKGLSSETLSSAISGAASGAVFGAIAGTGVGIIGLMTAGGATSAGGSVVDSILSAGLKNGIKGITSLDPSKVTTNAIKSGVIGAISGAVSGTLPVDKLASKVVIAAENRAFVKAAGTASTANVNEWLLYQSIATVRAVVKPLAEKSTELLLGVGQNLFTENLSKKGK